VRLKRDDCGRASGPKRRRESTCDATPRIHAGMFRALAPVIARAFDANARAVGLAASASSVTAIATRTREVSSSTTSSRASSTSPSTSSSSPPDAADPRAPTPPRRARVDVRDIMRARASVGQDDDVVGHLDDDEDDAEALAESLSRARSDAAKRKAFHAARGIDVDEIDGPRGLEPTRYGDWERAGRVSDF